MYRVTYNPYDRGHTRDIATVEGTGATFEEAIANCVSRVKEAYTGNSLNWKFYRQIPRPPVPMWEEFTP